jgi:hypothetical protein
MTVQATAAQIASQIATPAGESRTVDILHKVGGALPFRAVWVGAAIQNMAAKIDFEVLSLPGGSAIAGLLWIYAIATASIKRAATQIRA